MSSKKVLDTYSLLAFFENQAGGEKVAQLFKQARDSDRPLLLSVVAWSDIISAVTNSAGKDAANNLIQNIDTLPIQILPVDREIAKLAAEINANTKFSIPDRYSIASAISKKADLVSSNKDLKELNGLVNVIWI